MLEMTDKYRNAIYSKFKILDHINLLEVDRDPMILQDRLSKIKKNSYDVNERIIIEHFDTDFYLKDLPHGFTIHNVISAFKNCDIPTFVILLITNHFNILDDLTCLLGEDDHPPTIITTFISNIHYAQNFQDPEFNPNEIAMPAVSLMGQNRPHRNALYCFLQKNKLLDKVAVAIRPPRPPC